MMDSLQRLLSQRPIILQLLRFVAIGVLNTALDFIILNFISKSLGISSGFQLGTINVIGFTAAMIQSYFWNRHWTFDAQQSIDAVKNFVRLVVVGGIGALGFVAVIAGAKITAEPIFYILVLAIFIIAEIAAWIGFGLSGQAGSSLQSTQAGKQFLTFVIVSLIGLVINSSLVVVVSGYLDNTDTFSNPDLLKNAAKVAATGVSLIWNFIGYKVIVFRKIV